MDMNIVYPAKNPVLDRSFALSMTIKSFKGRRDVEVHLFRNSWEPSEEEAINWNAVVGEPLEQDTGLPPESSRKVILESFTSEERDTIVDYLKEQYATRLSAITSLPLDLPIPGGLPPLSSMSEGKSVGFIRFEKIPSYPLEYPLRGLYDLSLHKPIVENS